jgi:cytochrome c
MRGFHRIAPTGAIAVVALLATMLGARGDTIAEGRRFAEKNCARCHAVGKTGISTHPKAPPFRSIAAKGHIDDLQEALAEGIAVGHPDMPEFEVEPERIASLLAYLKTLAPGAE